MKKILFCALCTMVFAGAASALRVVPFVYDFDPSNDKQNDENVCVDKKKEFTYGITNKMDQTIAFEVVVYRRYTDKNGEEKLVKDDKSFLVFPAQLIIAPHTERSVKLRWVGNEDFRKNPHQEQAFRVAVKQYRINLNPFKKEKRGSSVEFNFQINASLYMTPGQSGSDVRVVKTENLPNGLSRIQVENKGNRRANYGFIRTDISIPGYKGPLYKALGRNDREGSLQPGEVHEFVVSAENTQQTKKAR